MSEETIVNAQETRSLRQAVVYALEQLPDDAVYEGILETVEFAYHIQISLEHAERGETIPHEEVMRRFAL